MENTVTMHFRIGGICAVEAFMHQNFAIQKIITACYVKPGTHRPVHTNRTSHGFAIVCDRPVEFIFSDSTCLTVGKNDIIYLPKGSSYLVKCADPGDVYAINFLTDSELNAPPFLFHTNDHLQFIDLFKSAEASWKRKKPGYCMKCMADLYQILYKLQAEYSAVYSLTSKQKLIMPAVDYIHEHYATEPLHISVLAELCGITPEYFRGIFKGIYNTSPIKYINNLKLSRAKELLKSNLYSVSEAAIMSGYNDLAHFSREFKNKYGISPSDYVKALMASL